MANLAADRLLTAEDWLDYCRSQGWTQGSAPILMVSYTGQDRRWVDEVHKYISDGLADVRDAATGKPFAIWDYADAATGTKLGGHFPTEIAQQMWTCQCAIVVFSQDYIGSFWCRDIELPFLLWRRKHHGIELFIIRVGETTRDGKPWRFPSSEGTSDSIRLEELVDDRNPALLAASKDFSGDFIDTLDRPRLNRRMTALAIGIERQVTQRQARLVTALEQANRKEEELALLNREAQALEVKVEPQADAQEAKISADDLGAWAKANFDPGQQAAPKVVIPIIPTVLLEHDSDVEATEITDEPKARRFIVDFTDKMYTTLSKNEINPKTLEPKRSFGRIAVVLTAFLALLVVYISSPFSDLEVGSDRPRTDLPELNRPVCEISHTVSVQRTKSPFFTLVFSNFETTNLTIVGIDTTVINGSDIGLDDSASTNDIAKLDISFKDIIPANSSRNILSFRENFLAKAKPSNRTFDSLIRFTIVYYSIYSEKITSSIKKEDHCVLIKIT